MTRLAFGAKCSFEHGTPAGLDADRRPPRTARRFEQRRQRGGADAGRGAAEELPAGLEQMEVEDHHGHRINRIATGHFEDQAHRIAQKSTRYSQIERSIHRTFDPMHLRPRPSSRTVDSETPTSNLLAVARSSSLHELSHATELEGDSPTPASTRTTSRTVLNPRDCGEVLRRPRRRIVVDGHRHASCFDDLSTSMPCVSSISMRLLVHVRLPSDRVNSDRVVDPSSHSHRSCRVRSS